MKPKEPQATVTTAWCVRKPRSSLYETDADLPLFCVSGLKKWNIPKGAKVRLVMSTHKYPGSQQSTPTPFLQCSGMIELVYRTMGYRNRGLQAKLFWHPEVWTEK